MEFKVNLLWINPQTTASNSHVQDNCTWIVDDFYFMEGEPEFLTEKGIELEILDDCIFVESLHEDDIDQAGMMEIAGLAFDENGEARQVLNG